MVKTFEEWRKRFERSIAHNSPAWSALAQFRTFLGQKPVPEVVQLITLPLDAGWADEIEVSALRLLYCYTLRPTPQPLDKSKKKRDEHARKALADLTKQIEGFVGHLKRTMQLDGTPGKVLVSGDLYQTIDLHPLLIAYESVMEYSRYILPLLKRPYVRQRDVIGRALGLIAILEDRVKVDATPTLDLVRLAMLANGYSADELRDFESPHRIKTIRDGKLRRRKETSQRQHESFTSDLTSRFKAVSLHVGEKK